MSKSQEAARQARRQRRAKRNQLALRIVHHIINPSLSEAEFAKVKAEFAKLFPARKEG